MSAQLIAAVVVTAFQRCVFDRAAHPLDLAIAPRMIGLGQAMFNPVGFADQIKPHLAERDAAAVPRLLRDLDAVIRQDRMDLVGHRFQKVLEELPSCLPIGLRDQLGHGELAGSVNGHKETELVFFCPDLGDIDVEIADRGAFELLALGFVACDVWQTGYPMPLKTAVQ
ncbi:hypothetical protein STA1M1_27320 [Sinisalibacter aestuarii]|uniref:Uncharacterized protein n=1 Tax=Sinisalibacter aestuarii TaxID=2949426 RepID=A0ABQ5LW72_9RHOB|nr:hypothetical protein STA1M1_27320 [Sinisalibacter aestuarii]